MKEYIKPIVMLFKVRPEVMQMVVNSDPKNAIPEGGYLAPEASGGLFDDDDE